MENKPALTSEQRLAYIGDMADIETREFTLRKIVETFEKTNQDLIAKPDRLLCKKNKINKRRQQALTEYQKTVEKETTEPPVKPEPPEQWDMYQNMEKQTCPSREFNIGHLIGYTFAAFAIIVFVGGLLCTIVDGIVPWFWFDEGYETISTILLLVPPFVIPLFINLYIYIGDCKTYKRRKKLYNISQAMSAHRWALQKYDLAQKKYEKYIDAENQYQKICQEYEVSLVCVPVLLQLNNMQITALKEDIFSTHTRKQELYAIDIIPPDYREMDCVIMLHQIFRNGLKDTMADAILLYEERVFRQEIIRGIDKIYDMLGQLNASMRAIETRLVEVKQELEMISSDISNHLAQISDNQSRIFSEIQRSDQAREEWQREQLAETRASRYAAEAVQRSNEKYEWYMDQHRQGFM